MRSSTEALSNEYEQKEAYKKSKMATYNCIRGERTGKVHFKLHN